MIVSIARKLVGLGFVVGLFGVPTFSVHAQSVSGFGLPANFFTRNCTTAQRQILQTAANEAKRLLIAGGTAAQFRRWFGVARDQSQLSLEIQSGVEYGRYYALESLTLLGAAATTFTTAVIFDCAGGRQSSLAHVTGPGTGVVYLDVNYWTVPDRPSLQHVSKASVIIHELTHLAGTGDFADDFGYADTFRFALDLALLWPGASIFNAENHEYFYTGQ